MSFLKVRLNKFLEFAEQDLKDALARKERLQKSLDECVENIDELHQEIAEIKELIGE